MEHKTKSAASEGSERAQNAKEIPERLDFGLSGSVSADSGCSTWRVEPDPA